MLVRRSLVLLALLALVPFLLAACGGDDEAAPDIPAEEGPPEAPPEEAEEPEDETRTLRVVSFLATDHQAVREMVPRWMELVEEASGGSLQPDWTGGPDAVPVEDQFDAVANGLVEVGFNVPVFYTGQVPVGQAMVLSPLTPAEERDNGFADFLDRVHREGGVAYVGRWLSVSPQYFWVNDRAETLDDLRGRRMRSVPTYHHILQELGATPVNILPGEVFTALERGVVDGYGFPLLGPREQGWTEVTRFLIDEPFFNQNGAIIMNPDAYDQLSERQQEALAEATRTFEEELVEFYRELNGDEWQALQDEVEPISLSPEDSERFVSIWYESTWGTLEEGAPDDVEEAKQLLQYEELSGNSDRIREIPCAGLGPEAAADEEFC